MRQKNREGKFPRRKEFRAIQGAQHNDDGSIGDFIRVPPRTLTPAAFLCLWLSNLLFIFVRKSLVIIVRCATFSLRMPLLPNTSVDHLSITFPQRFPCKGLCFLIWPLVQAYPFAIRRS